MRSSRERAGVKGRRAAGLPGAVDLQRPRNQALVTRPHDQLRRYKFFKTPVQNISLLFSATQRMGAVWGSVQAWQGERKQNDAVCGEGGPGPCADPAPVDLYISWLADFEQRLRAYVPLDMEKACAPKQ